MYHPLHFFVLSLVLLIHVVLGNTEKVIFKAPTRALHLFSDLPRLEPIGSSRVGRLIYELETPFYVGDNSTPATTEQWFLIHNLGRAWQYELRVCWPAIMPTIFDLAVVSHEEYMQSSGLVLHQKVRDRSDGSQLFLRLRARPDFVLPGNDIIRSPPVVKFELVVDPLLFGLVPRSIAGTIVLILLAAALGLRVISPKVLNVIEERIKERRQKVVRIKTH